MKIVKSRKHHLVFLSNKSSAKLNTTYQFTVISAMKIRTPILFAVFLRDLSSAISNGISMVLLVNVSGMAPQLLIITCVLNAIKQYESNLFVAIYSEIG